MTDYRITSKHIRYWRGVPHRWSMDWPFTGTLAAGDWPAAIAAIRTLVQGIGFQHSSGVSSGGNWGIDLYNETAGGVPLASVSYFNPATIPFAGSYTGAGWSDLTAEFEGQAEVALQLRWPAGLSSTGKAVYFRKWSHAVPIGNPSGTADVSSGDITGLAAIVNAQIAVIGGLGAPMGKGGRLAATSVTVEPFYGNHQMPKGRRKKAAKTVSTSLPLGIDPKTGELVLVP
jgi:hypothetical protein